jgi:hypothetical protein
MGRNYIKETLPPAQRIIITQEIGGVNEQDGEFRYQEIGVTAPLPDGFGMSVGSSFDTPFDTGNINDTLSKLFVLGGLSRKAGIRMEKAYVSPEPTEISFDMEFYAWYDAGEEVLKPVATLMCMAVGRELTWDELKNSIDKMYRKVSSGAFSLADQIGLELPAEPDTSGLTVDERVDSGASRLMELIQLIQGPPTSRISFGNVITLEEAFISSVSCKFSNVLDPKGFPMSCTCSVTAVLKSAPVMGDLTTMFGNQAFDSV